MSGRLQVVVCRGPTCAGQRGADALADRFARAIAARGLAGRVSVERETCFGHCLRGANAVVAPVDEPGEPPSAVTAVMYTRLVPGDVDRIVDRHLVEGQIVWALVGRPETR